MSEKETIEKFSVSNIEELLEHYDLKKDESEIIIKESFENHEIFRNNSRILGYTCPEKQNEIILGEPYYTVKRNILGLEGYCTSKSMDFKEFHCNCCGYQIEESNPTEKDKKVFDDLRRDL